MAISNWKFQRVKHFHAKLLLETCFSLTGIVKSSLKDSMKKAVDNSSVWFNYPELQTPMTQWTDDHWSCCCCYGGCRHCCHSSISCASASFCLFCASDGGVYSCCHHLHHLRRSWFDGPAFHWLHSPSSRRRHSRHRLPNQPNEWIITRIPYEVHSWIIISQVERGKRTCLLAEVAIRLDANRELFRPMPMHFSKCGAKRDAAMLRWQLGQTHSAGFLLLIAADDNISDAASKSIASPPPPVDERVVSSPSKSHCVSP